METSSYLLKWIPFNKLSWKHLSKNKNAIHLLELNLDKIDWYYISNNSSAISIIENNLDKINWYYLSLNPSARHLFLNPNKINNLNLNDIKSCYPNIPIYRNTLIENRKSNYDDDDYEFECINFYRLINEIPINYYELCKNRSKLAIDFLETNKSYINWLVLSQNPIAIHLLEANPNKINWQELSRNPAAIHLLELNQDKINWSSLSENPSIFDFNQYDIILK
jgi:hypothetical protein